MKKINVVLLSVFLLFFSVSLHAYADGPLFQYMNRAVLKTGMNSLNKREGDLRRTSPAGTPSVWARGYYSDFSYDGSDLKADIFGGEAGVDTRVFRDSEDRFYIGLTGGYISTLDVKTQGVNVGEAYAPSAGIYGTWLNKNGWFADLTARNFFYTAKFSAGGKADWNMTAASLELGKEFKFDINGISFFTVEPKVKGLYGFIPAKTVNYSGLYLNTGEDNVMLGRAAVLLAYSRTLRNCAKVEPYIEGGYTRDFSPDGKLSYGPYSYEQKFSGGSFDIGGGVNIIANDKISLYSYAGYENGNHIRNIMANAGVRIALAGVTNAKKCCGAAPQTPAPVRETPPQEPADAPAVIAAPYEEMPVVHFNFDKSAVRPQDDEKLKEAAEIIKNSKDVYEVTGYTDRIGASLYNMGLSERRARSVYDRLLGLGVSSDRLEYKGFGFSNPVNQARTREADAENRRVEIIKRE